MLDAIFFVLRSGCQWRLILVVMVTAASVQDRPGGKAILQRLAARFPASR